MHVVRYVSQKLYEVLVHESVAQTVVNVLEDVGPWLQFVGCHKHLSDHFILRCAGTVKPSYYGHQAYYCACEATDIWEKPEYLVYHSGSELFVFAEYNRNTDFIRIFQTSRQFLDSKKL
jgi:hypothetical protein